MAEPSRAFKKRLDHAKGFVLDMDGTLVLGDKRNKGLTALPGAIDLIAHLRERGLPFVAFTNGTVRPPRDYVEELAHAGLALHESEIMTPSSVAADYLPRKGFRRVMAMGGDGVGGPLAAAGLEVLKPPEHDAIDAIFVGWFRDFSMNDIEAACEAVWGGAKLFSASLAPFFATANGRTLGTSCAIVGAIRQITGCPVRLLGKPSLEGLRVASRKLRVPMADLAVIGDDPGLEIQMAHKGGALAIGVTTGIAQRDAFTSVPKEKRAHFIAANVGEVLDLWRGA